MRLDAKLIDDIQLLPVEKIVSIDTRIGDLDLAVLAYMGDYKYWIVVAVMNNIVDPFDLLRQGFTTLKFPYVHDADALMHRIDSVSIAEMQAVVA